jgi:chromosome segregation ATPase
MRKLLETLLILFALGLCGIIAFQWKREFDLGKQRQDLANRLRAEQGNLRDVQASLKRAEGEVIRLTDLKSELTATNKVMREEITRLRKGLEKCAADLERNQEQTESYKIALTTANENVKRQNEDIQRQNNDMKRLAEERNDAVRKHNDTAKLYNDLVEKWNKFQEELTADAQKGAPKK